MTKLTALQSEVLKRVKELQPVKVAGLALSVGMEPGNTLTRAINTLIDGGYLHRDGLLKIRITIAGNALLTTPVKPVRKKKAAKPRPAAKARTETPVTNIEDLKGAVAMPTATLKTPEPQVTADVEQPGGDNSSVMQSLKKLEGQLNLTLPEVSEKELKLQVLERLAALLSDDISEVLMSIHSDISPLADAVNDGAAA